MEEINRDVKERKYLAAIVLGDKVIMALHKVKNRG